MISVVKRRTASEQVYFELKKMIAQRQLAPGQPLVAQTLANQMGVSRTPVVEALRRLERDGLVVTSPKWGASVREWTAHDIYEAYCIRRVLEGEAARLFVLHAKPEDKKKLVPLSDAFDECSKFDMAKACEIDLELHLHIARSTGFRRLYELVESSKIATVVIYGVATERHRDREEADAAFDRTTGSHKPLVDALLGDDPVKAQQAMWRHMDTLLEFCTKLAARDSSLPQDAFRTALGG
ncbi:MAG: GntR family transcriptional regulator [Acidobacteriota bacterium]